MAVHVRPLEGPRAPAPGSAHLPRRADAFLPRLREHLARVVSASLLLLACAGPVTEPLPECPDDDELATLSAHVAALDGVRALLSGVASREEAVAFAAFAPVLPVGPARQGVGDLCARGRPVAPLCVGTTCWQVACTSSGWESELVSSEGDILEHSTLVWEGRLRWLASARLSGEDGADWSAAQQGVLVDGILTIGESWEGLRPGHVAELRATWSPRGGATGALRFDGEDVAWIDGYAVTAVRSSACR